MSYFLYYILNQENKYFSLFEVTQLPCGFTNLAPQGCTQWYTGNSGASCFETFNYDNGYHLADQEQIMCVR